jgi:outer membrane protein TolC
MEVKAGEVSETDISPIMTQLNDANILVSSTQANMLGIIYRLAVLSGKMPEEMLKSLITNEVDIIQYDAGIVPVGLKSDVLKRRADVKMAEFELSASILDAKAQGKEFFPTFNLTGTLGYGNTTLGSAFSNPKQIVNASAFFNWPLFQGGGVIAGFEISKLQAKLALMNYESTILSAISDAETAILNYANALALSGEAKASLILAGKVLNMTTNQFNAGEISEKEFLNAKLARNQAYISYLGYHSNSITSLIAVHKAIGGGFEGYTLTVEKDKVIYKKNE